LATLESAEIVVLHDAFLDLKYHRVCPGIGVVKNNKDGSTNFVGFDEIINAHNVSKFIIGLPLDKGGKAQEMTFIAK
jgi:RNase H-fold protein (predicted Holliday junction resolvase)